MLEEYRKVKVVCEASSLSDDVSSFSVWQPPPSNMLRLDVDAGCDMCKNRFSVGVIVRDYNGTVLGAKACLLRHATSVKCAELYAIRFGIDFCLAQGYTNVCIFSDSIQAVRAVHHPDEDLSPEGVIALEIKNYLKFSEFVSMKHMRRSANLVARRLAREVLLSGSNLELINCTLLSCLCAIVSRDSRF